MIWMLSLLACGPQPTRLDYVSAMTVYDGNLVTPSVQVFDQDEQRMEGQAVLIARSTRAEVVSITNEGFYCLKSGSSELTLQVGKLEQSLSVACQLVDVLKVQPDKLRIILTRDGSGWAAQDLETPAIEILDEQGGSLKELLSPPVSSDDNVVLVHEDGRLEAVGLGRSVLTWSAGGKRTELTVDVGRLVDENIRLDVPPGGRQVVPLKPGLQVADLRSSRRITAWMVSPDCGEPMEGSRIDGLECEIGDRGTLVVENPSRSTARVGVKLIVFAESGS